MWRELVDRFGAGVLEFYASTEGALVLANAAGDKVGALGRPLPGSSDVVLLAYDFAAGAIARSALGRGRRVREGEPGVLAGRLETATTGPAERVARDVFEPGDAWLTTGDLVRRDADGDYWFIDRLADVVHTAEGPVPSRPIEDTLYELPEVALAIVYGVRDAACDGGLGAELGAAPSGAPNVDSDGEVPAAAIVLRPGAAIDGAALFAALSARHPIAHLPRVVRLVPALPMTEGFRPLKAALRAELEAALRAEIEAARRAEGSPGVTEALRLDVAHGAYRPE